MLLKVKWIVFDVLVVLFGAVPYLAFQVAYFVFWKSTAFSNHQCIVSGTWSKSSEDLYGYPLPL